MHPHQQIRRSVFETNSSSSHSLTLGRGDLVSQPFSAATLRSGVVRITPDHYGWEWTRYYTAENKLAYLVTQLLQGREPDSESELDEAGFTEKLRATDPRFDLLCRVVSDHTGCQLLVERADCSVDHDSLGVGLELFKDEDALRDFLFDETACVQTGNDNSEMPWKISTDRGVELAYAKQFAEPGADYVTVDLRGSDDLEPHALATAQGGLLLWDDAPDSLYSRLIKEGVVLRVVQTLSGASPRQHTDGFSEALSALLACMGGDLRLSPTLKSESRYKEDDEAAIHYRELEVTVAVPPALAQALDALAPDGALRHSIERLSAQAAHYANPESGWARRMGAHFERRLHSAQSKLARLQAKLSTERETDRPDSTGDA